MVESEEAAAEAFEAWVERVVNGVVTIADPAAVHVVRVDHWFDRKWLRFSGKALGALAVWRGDLTVPPFHPHRVRSELRYRREGPRDYRAVVPTPTLHREQPSSRNLYRRIRVVAPATACFWYSSDAAAVGRGALLAYVPSPSGFEGWYAGMMRAGTGWRAMALPGITAQELAFLEEKGHQDKALTLVTT